MRSITFKLISLLFLLLILLVLASYSIHHSIHLPNTLTSSVTVEMKQGDTIRSLAAQLKQKALFDHPRHLEIWARLKGLSHRLQAGEYAYSPNTSIADLINKIIKGKVIQHTLTLVEGWSFKQMMQALNQNEIIRHTLQGLSNEQIMEKLGYSGQHPEGRFFPDTFYVHRNMTDADVLKQAYNTMSKTLSTAWESREEGLPLKTSYEALILASIVEKESAAAEERPLIAGVFINRLRKKMRLQTDPTVIYGIGDKYDGDIRYRDLRTDTPYNTYTRAGLPPTPIAMPGREAIEAVMHPDKTNYLFFVAMRDNSGRHVFSSTLSEHQKAVNKHQKNR